MLGVRELQKILGCITSAELTTLPWLKGFASTVFPRLTGWIPARLLQNAGAAAVRATPPSAALQPTA
jgi:hypothetical protein